MIYLAGPCSPEHRTMMTTIGKFLREQLKYEVYCPFELKIENAWDYTQEEWAWLVFQKDIEAIENSDIMVSISTGRIGSGGTPWEQGYAYKGNKDIFVFQITDKPTSVMTKNGCMMFVNTNRKEILDSIRMTFEDYKSGKIKEPKYQPCTTVLT